MHVHCVKHVHVHMYSTCACAPVYQSFSTIRCVVLVNKEIILTEAKLFTIGNNARQTLLLSML